MTIELERRINRLEAQVEAKLEWDQLKQEFAKLHTEPTLHRLLGLIDKHPSAFRAVSGSVDNVRQQDRGEQLDIVMGHADMISQTAAQLNKLNSLSVPSLQASQSLTVHTEELGRLRAIAEEQDHEIESLVQRTVALLDNWYTQYVRPTNAAMVDVDRKLSSSLRDFCRLEQDRD